MKPAKRKQKKPTKTQLRTRADKFFSLYIRDRDRICQTRNLRPESCERDRFLQCAHIVSRSYLATRLDPGNALGLCRSCHTYYTNHPLEWEHAIAILCGPLYLDRIKTRALDGARNAIRPDWEAEADKWESEWLTRSR